MRGFTVHQLSTNPDDAQFDAPGAPAMSREEERSDRILANGARFYNDHGHPEYATPECRSLRDLVAHDKAGERIPFDAAQRRARQRGLGVTLYKNNTDFHGASYGTHEGYLLARGVPTDAPDPDPAAVPGLPPDLRGRGQIRHRGRGAGQERDLFQLSQRADFVSVEASIDTLHNRPLVNTRDEPHAAARALPPAARDLRRREHERIRHGAEGGRHIAGAEAAGGGADRAGQAGQRGPGDEADLAGHYPAPDGRAAGRAAHHGDRDSAHLSDQAKKRLAGLDEDADWTLAEWEWVLDALEKDPLTLSEHLDWVAKYTLLNGFREEEGLRWTDPHVQSLDLAYHNVDPDQGLYYGLDQAGAMRRLVTDGRTEAAMSCPPGDTRAFIRGLFVERFGASVRSIGWNGIAFRHNGEDIVFDMNTLVGEDVRVLNEELANAETLDEFVKLIQRPSSEISEVL